jgi:glutamate decarboxylase
MFTYEIAPVFILMENVVLSHMRKIIGKEFENGDSILAPGGSISNLYAFLGARHKMFPDYKELGARATKGELVMFTSDQCHYSVKACASVCGLGTDNCVAVPSDEKGRMIVSELERLILERKARGQIPFFVNATAGTTVLGAFDPLNQIADICEKYNCWMHVDVRQKYVRKFPKNHSLISFFSFLLRNAGCLGWWSTSFQELPSSKINRR